MTYYKNILFICLIIAIFAACKTKVKKADYQLQNKIELSAIDNKWETYQGDVFIEFLQQKDEIIVGLLNDKNSNKTSFTFFIIQTKKHYFDQNKVLKNATILEKKGYLTVIGDGKAFGFTYGPINKKDNLHVSNLVDLSGLSSSEVKASTQIYSYSAYGISENHSGPKAAPSTAVMKEAVENKTGFYEAILNSRAEYFKTFSISSISLVSLQEKQPCLAGGEGADEGCSYTCGVTSCDIDSCEEGYYPCCGCNTEIDAGAFCKCREEQP